MVCNWGLQVRPKDRTWNASISGVLCIARCRCSSGESFIALSPHFCLVSCYVHSGTTSPKWPFTQAVWILAWWLTRLHNKLDVRGTISQVVFCRKAPLQTLVVRNTSQEVRTQRTKQQETTAKDLIHNCWGHPGVAPAQPQRKDLHVCGGQVSLKKQQAETCGLSSMALFLLSCTFTIEPYWAWLYWNFCRG